MAIDIEIKIGNKSIKASITDDAYQDVIATGAESEETILKLLLDQLIESISESLQKHTADAVYDPHDKETWWPYAEAS